MNAEVECKSSGYVSWLSLINPHPSRQDSLPPVVNARHVRQRPRSPFRHLMCLRQPHPARRTHEQVQGRSIRRVAYW